LSEIGGRRAAAKRFEANLFAAYGVLLTGCFAVFARTNTGGLGSRWRPGLFAAILDRIKRLAILPPLLAAAHPWPSEQDQPDAYRTRILGNFLGETPDNA
jgi:hypothetical protein